MRTVETVALVFGTAPVSNECEVVYAADHAESGHPIAKRQAL
jgi:hypothetical protein